MKNVTFKGETTKIAGSLPAVETAAPDFMLTQADLKDVGLEAFGDKVKILNIVVSLDTGVCAASAQKFSQAAGRLRDTVIINVSADLPFAQKRFCESHSLTNVTALSTMRGGSFGMDYGVQIVSGPLAGLLSRAVVVLGRDNRVVYGEQVPEIASEPNYDAALKAAEQAAR